MDEITKWTLLIDMFDWFLTPLPQNRDSLQPSWPYGNELIWFIFANVVLIPFHKSQPFIDHLRIIFIYTNMLTYKPYFGIQICSHNIREFFMDRINLENQEKNLELSVIDE